MTRKELFESTNVPSELLSHALTDLKLAVADGCKVDMMKWFVTDQDGVYHLCLAGAVIYTTFGIRLDKSDSIPISSLGVDNANKLFAINYLRVGAFYGAFADLGIDRELKIPGFIEDCNFKKPAEFYESMEEIVKILVANNL